MEEIARHVAASQQGDDFENAFLVQTCASTAMQEEHDADALSQTRWGVMNRNPDLLREAEEEIDRRVRAYGMKEEPDISEKAKNQAPVYRKAKALYNIEHTPSTPSGGVDAWMFLGAKHDHKVSVYLPISATLDEALDLFDGICLSNGDFGAYARPARKGDQREKPKRAWKYNWITLESDGHATCSPASVALDTDAEYRHMTRMIARSKPNTLIAAISKVSLLESIPQKVSQLMKTNRILI